MKSVVGLYENRQAVGGATDPQLHSNRTVIHFKREYLVQLYYTRGETPTFVNYVIAHNKARRPGHLFSIRPLQGREYPCAVWVVG